MDRSPERRRAGAASDPAFGKGVAAPAANAAGRGHFEYCSACLRPNERPYVFCDHCGAPRVRLGQWRLVLYLVLTTAAFLGTFYFQGALTWDWPLYALYVSFFMQFSSSLVSGYRRLEWRVGVWEAVLFGSLAVFYYFLTRDGAGVFLEVAADGPETAIEHPLVFYSILAGAVAAVFVPGYIRWGRLYGWANAYRLVMLSWVGISMAALGTVDLAQWASRRDLFPALSESLGHLVDSRPQYAGGLILFAVITGRILVIEIFVSAATRGYAAARRATMPGLPPAAAKESGFTRSLLRIALIVRHFVLILEKMTARLFHTLVLLAEDLWLAGLAFARELLAPAVAMLVCGTLLYECAVLTKTYVAENSLGSVGKIVAAVCGILLGEMVFLACKTHFRWGRVVVFHAQFLGWLLPNLLVFFLLASLSLYASTAAWNSLSSPGDPRLPFRIGLLTKAVAGILGGLVLFIFARKRALLLAQPRDKGASAGAEAEAAPAARSARPGEPSEPARDVELPTREQEKEPSWRSRARRLSPRILAEGGARRLLAKAAGLAERVGLSRGAQTVLESARRFSQRLLEGKPKVLEELAGAKAQCREKTAQMAALESTRGAISEETFEALHWQYRKELNDLSQRRDKLQAQVDLEYADWLVEKAKIEARLRQCTARKEECERLYQAGALAEKEFKSQTRKIQSALDEEMARREMCDMLIVLFAEEISGAAKSKGSPTERNPEV